MARRLERTAIEAHLGYWLHYVGYRISHELCLRTQKFGVTAAESLFLRALDDEEGAMPCHLALRLGLSRGFISKLAARLDAKELITRERSLSDGRAQSLRLTLFGRVLVSTLAALADETDARNFGGVSRAARETIEGYMKWIVRRDGFRFVPATNRDTGRDRSSVAGFKYESDPESQEQSASSAIEPHHDG